MKRKLAYWVTALVEIIVLSVVPAVAAAAASDTTITGTIPLFINNVTVPNLDYSSASISWQTNVSADSQVEYGIYISYGLTTPLATALVTSHTVQLTGLTSGTTYHFRVKSQATINGTDFVATSNDYTFTTLSPSGGGGGGVAVIPMKLSQPGTTGTTLVTETNVTLDSRGVSQTAGQITTTDGKVSFDVPGGTQMLNAQGKPLTEVLVTVPTSVPPLPAQDAIVLHYDFGPDGATFAPPITLTLKYDMATIPQGVSESTLFIAYWDGSQWQVLATTVDTVAKTVTALVHHFTDFAVMGKLPALAPTPPIKPAPTTPPITPVPTPMPITPTPMPPTITPTPTPPTILALPWALIIGILAAIVVVGLVIFFLMAGRRRRHKNIV